MLRLLLKKAFSSQFENQMKNEIEIYPNVDLSKTKIFS